MAGLDEERDLGRPGEYPFTRGVQPTMYRSRFWTMRQYAGFATAEETNRRFRYLLEQGQTGLSVAFDLPTQMGYDSDAPRGGGRGRPGRGARSRAWPTWRSCSTGCPLGEVSTSMTINATAPILLALYVAAAEAPGRAPRAAIAGTTQNDILKEYIARGHLHLPAAAVDAPRDRRLRVLRRASCPTGTRSRSRGYHMREAGATAAQELAFTLADAIAYVEAAVARGLDVDDFAGRLSLLLRRLVASCSRRSPSSGSPAGCGRRSCASASGRPNPRSMVCRFHVQTAGSSLTAQSIDNNVVRTTIQALAAVLGGAQSLHTNSRDEALALPTEEAARLALRTQQILAYEAGVTETPDPLAGSYYVESLTNELEAAAWAYLDEIEAMGGTLAAIEARLPAAPDPGGGLPRPAGDRVGRPGRRRASTASATTRSARRRSSGSTPTASAARSSASGGSAPSAPPRPGRPRWTRLEAAARGDGNLMPPILEAVRAYATVGEISDRLRVAWGEHRELITV